MGHPNRLSSIRHAESDYNAKRRRMATDPDYQRFMRAYKARSEDPETVLALARSLTTDEDVKHKFVMTVGDPAVPLSKFGPRQAEAAGPELRKKIATPDAILLPPYRRTRETLGWLKASWPALEAVTVIEDERLREQERGRAEKYCDWRMYEILYPEEAAERRRLTAYWYRYPGGESTPDVRERLRSIHRDIIGEYVGLELLVVGHHNTTIAQRANCQNLDPREVTRLLAATQSFNCGFTTYRGYEGGLELEAFNEPLPNLPIVPTHSPATY